MKIAGFFIAAIVAVSLVSRLWRTLELRVERIELDDAARRFVDEAGDGELHIIANHPDNRDFAEYEEKEREIREDFDIPPDQPVLFLEVYVRDASDFSDVLRVRGGGAWAGTGCCAPRRRRSPTRSRRCCSTCATRRARGRTPTSTGREGNPLLYLIRYVLSGRGDIAPVTREVLRQAEPDPARRARHPCRDLTGPAGARWGPQSAVTGEEVA